MGIFLPTAQTNTFDHMTVRDGLEDAIDDVIAYINMCGAFTTVG